MNRQMCRPRLILAPGIPPFQLPMNIHPALAAVDISGWSYKCFTQQIILLKIPVESIEDVERLWLESLNSLCSRKEIHSVFRAFIMRLCEYQPLEQLDIDTERAIKSYIHHNMRHRISNVVADIQESTEGHKRRFIASRHIERIFDSNDCEVDFSTKESKQSSPTPAHGLSMSSPVARGKRKAEKLPGCRENLRIRLQGCQSSESDQEEVNDEDDSSDSDDDTGYALGTDFDSTIFTGNNDKEEGWMLESGRKVKVVLDSKTLMAIDRVKKSGKRDSCALSVIRLGLSSIIDLSSEFQGGMREWFGEDWPTLKTKALECLDTTAKQFESPIKTDIEKIMEFCTSYKYWEARSFLLEKLMDNSIGLLHQQVMRSYFFVVDMFLADPHVFVNKDGTKHLSEFDFVIRIIAPILNIIFSDQKELLLKWGETMCKTSRRRIDLRIICEDVELSHSECSRAVTRTKLIKDRSKCLRTNKCVLDGYLMNDLPDETVENSTVLGLQFAGLYGQVIGIDLLDNGLYFGFEGPAFEFPSQLCYLSSLQETLEALFFFKDNVVRRAKALTQRGKDVNPLQKIFYSKNKRKPHHRKVDFIRKTYFTPQKVSVANEIETL